MKKDKKLLLFLALVLVSVLLFSSVPASAGENPGRGKSLAEARKALEQELLPLAGAGFVGITHSEAEDEVIVFVEDEQTRPRVPRSFKGYTVRTEVTGKIQPLSTQVAEPLTDVSEERKTKVRPLVGGISLSAYVTKGSLIYLYAGTLGMVTYDDKILSNAHVIAMNPETGEFLATGTPILQPGSRDGGRIGNQVGALQKYIPIDFDPGAKNYADAAIGSIDGSVEASPGEQFYEEGNYWIEGWADVSQGNIVRKSGRTTGVTTGEVIYTNVSVVVRYGDQSAYFVDQIAVVQDNWSFAAPGDSGSAVDNDGKFVGLVFAGSA
ncbi:MAG: S1 family peptidase, partial [Dehalococcoidia bacterium]|nr:S1 family peptidase [Dehalococcoidia bacterium]